MDLANLNLGADFRKLRRLRKKWKQELAALKAQTSAHGDAAEDSASLGASFSAPHRHSAQVEEEAEELLSASGLAWRNGRGKAQSGARD